MKPRLRRPAALALGICVCLSLAACGQNDRGSTSPERLVDAHLAALEANDPRAAYALLSPQAQAKTPYEAFEARWERDAAEREATIEAAKNRSPGERGATRAGTSVHSGGHVLHWTEVGGEYLVVSGLPGHQQSATPAQAIRAFITAVRRADLTEIRGLLTEELAEALDDDWEARVDAIERALDQPGSLELSADLKRAALRYEPNLAMTLEQTAQGWRILSLQ